MKTRLFGALTLLVGSSLFAAPRIAVGIGVGLAAPPPPVVAYAAAPAYVAPVPGYTWVAGYWYPAGGRYVWHAGYWAHPPYAGAYWVAPRYYGGHFYSGYWHRR